MSMTGIDRSEPTTDESSATVEPIVDATPDTGAAIAPKVIGGEGQIRRFSIIAWQVSVRKTRPPSVLRERSGCRRLDAGAVDLLDECCKRVRQTKALNLPRIDVSRKVDMGRIGSPSFDKRRVSRGVDARNYRESRHSMMSRLRIHPLKTRARSGHPPKTALFELLPRQMTPNDLTINCGDDMLITFQCQ